MRCVPSGRFAQAAGAEMAAVVLYLVVMVTLVLTDAGLAP